MNKVKSKFTAIVACRSGSKGLQLKNFRTFADSSLAEIAINQGIRTCSEVIFSSDIDLDKFMVSSGTVIRDLRPEGLCEDEAKIESVLKYLIDKFKLIDRNVVLLQATSPLRTDNIVREAQELYLKSEADLIMSVSSLDSGLLKPGFIKNGLFEAVSEQRFCFLNRQELPKLYRPNGLVYVFNSSWFISSGGFKNATIGTLYCENNISIDIDNLDDFKKAEELYKKLKIQGKENFD